MLNLSLVVLTRNSERMVKNNLIKIKNHLENLKLDNFEIIVSDFSEDKTFEIVNSLNDDMIKPVKAPRKGIGCGITTGFNIAQFPYIMFYPIDMSWKLNIIEESLTKLNEGYDVVLGSRFMEGSQTDRPIKRQIFSKSYNALINMLFNLKIKDTQGTCALRKSDYSKYKNKLKTDSPFLQTELLIHSKLNNLKIIEIPSYVTDKRKDSSVKIWSFALNMINDAIKKKISLLKE